MPLNCDHINTHPNSRLFLVKKIVYQKSKKLLFLIVVYLILHGIFIYTHQKSKVPPGT